VSWDLPFPHAGASAYLRYQTGPPRRYARIRQADLRMIDGRDCEQLGSALRSAYPDRESLRRMVLFHLGDELNDYASDRNLEAAVADLVRRYRDADLERLLAAALAGKPDNQFLQATVAALRSKLSQARPIYRAVDPFQSCLPSPNTPFIDRQPLRQTLNAMVQSPAGTLLAVQGAPRSGKSFTQIFINYLAAELRRYHLIAIDFADVFPGYHADDLAVEIVNRLGRSDRIAHRPRQTEEGKERWVYALAHWVVGEIQTYAASSPVQRVWLVLDGLPQAASGIVDDSVQSLVLRLATMVHAGASALTVILLGHGDALPKVEPLVQRDRIERPTWDDVRHFYATLIAGTGRTIDNALLDQLTDATWTDASPHDEGDVAWMDRLVGAVRGRLPGLLSGAWDTPTTEDSAAS
jgi:hypothetical protein